MSLFNKESRLCDALFCDASLIPVVERFGISLGMGDISIQEVCLKHEINSDFFLAIINTFLNEDYFQENLERSIDIPMLVGFLKKTNDYYSNIQLPNIERHFRYLIDRSGPDNNLQHIFRFFLEIKMDLNRCDLNDVEVCFPKIMDRLIHPDFLNETDENLNSQFRKQNLDGLILNLKERELVEEKIGDLESLFIMHINGDYDHTLALAVINALFMLHKDIRQNNRIRSRIFLPAVASMLNNG